MAEKSFEERIVKLNEIIQESDRIAFFGGAGVSTESGIPDFRSKDGLYNTLDAQFDKYEPEYLLSHSCLYHNPKVFFEFYRQKMDIRNIQPNPAHYKLAELEKAGKMTGVVTQNIDGLHQKAGSKKVYEIHGTTLRNYCTGCGKELSADFIFTSKSSIPLCPDCGKMVRPDVTLYEEMLPKAAFNKGAQAIYEANCLIISGTSLLVTPANTLVNGYFGKYIIVINKEPIDIEQYADLVFREPVGEVMSKIVVKE